MNRLVHTPRAFIRSLQMGRSKLIVFVEGRKTDSYVYGKVCSYFGSPFFYRIIRSEEIPGTGAGKKRLLSHFESMRRNGYLIIDFKGHKAVTAFMLDKDVDDWKRIKKKSRHVIYTRYYDIENYVFAHGDIVEAVAAACSEDPGRVGSHFPDLCWAELAADRWRDWVKLCLAASQLRVRGVTNFGSPSRVNRGVCGNVDKEQYENFLLEIKNRSGISAEEFDRKFRRIARKVDLLYTAKRHDEIFKGKWYKLQLQEEIRLTIGKERAIPSLGDGVVNHMMQTLNFDDPWVEDFRKPLQDLLNTLDS
ncbi:hypothetical protein [Microbispora bryophytorum]|uniref:hypothetical protein n=1 Tax=Microbispora bryophytorum TaxID=1460882 RepID=UPI00341082AC